MTFTSYTVYLSDIQSDHLKFSTFITENLYNLEILWFRQCLLFCESSGLLPLLFLQERVDTICIYGSENQCAQEPLTHSTQSRQVKTSLDIAVATMRDTRQFHNKLGQFHFSTNIGESWINSSDTGRKKRRKLGI